MSGRETLMRRVQMHGFVAHEANLYLDTHPYDTVAQDYFKLHMSAAKAAASEYEANFGPLTVSDYDGGGWKWVNEPWPWENLGGKE